MNLYSSLAYLLIPLLTLAACSKESEAQSQDSFKDAVAAAVKQERQEQAAANAKRRGGAVAGSAQGAKDAVGASKANANRAALEASAVKGSDATAKAAKSGAASAKNLASRQGSSSKRYSTKAGISQRLVRVLPLVTTESPRLGLRGHLKQGGLVFGRATAPVKRAYLGARKLHVRKDGRFLLAFGRNHSKRETLRVLFRDGKHAVEKLSIKQRDYGKTAIDGLDDDQVTPPKHLARQLLRNNKRVAKVRRRHSSRRDFEEGFVWPLHGKITDTFGTKRTLNGKDKGYHFGVDIARKRGKIVVAPAGGKVVFVHKKDPLAGQFVVLDHGAGLSSTFLHLSRILVKVGQEVKQGQRIGRVGNTGRSTGAHLDWRMNLNATRIDPALLVPRMKWRVGKQNT